MNFADPAFLLGFLPIVLVTFYAIRLTLGGEYSSTFMIAASAMFYAWWSVPFLGMLIAQLLVNYYVAKRLRERESRLLLVLAICANLALLGYFKYRNFFLENIYAIAGHYHALPSLIVPLGISFHTFQQIAFMITSNGARNPIPPLKHYAMFVLFFPQLVAGPITLNHEFEPQAEAADHGRGIDWDNVCSGLIIFLLGLFKKVVLADNMAGYADTAFDPSLHLQPIEAWVGTFAFVFQIFFDFAGYSDMAIGLGLMFGIRLPANFRDPLRSTSIVEFWSRWHITMTRFFMTYVYSPMSLHMMRRSSARRHGKRAKFFAAAAYPTVVTFLVAGFWHGANWTFGFYGLSQGIAISINQAWRQFRLPAPPRFVGWLLTFITFALGEVFFRATTVHQAVRMLISMFSPWTIGVPNWLALHAGGIAAHLPVRDYPFLNSASFTMDVLFWEILLFVLVFALPNIAVREKPLTPNLRLAAASAAMACLVASYVGAPRTFIYFQF